MCYRTSLGCCCLQLRTQFSERGVLVKLTLAEIANVAHAVQAVKHGAALEMA